jgi:Cu2+-exporting ATPase
VPGCGVEALAEGCPVRLGRPEWVAEIADGDVPDAGPAFARGGGAPFAFSVAETLRDDAPRVVAGLRELGLPVELLSGDAAAAVGKIAEQIPFDEVRHGAKPADKVAHLGILRAAGWHTLMVGDGLNDAAALAAAHVSMAPGSASDAGRMAADFVAIRDDLGAILTAHRFARRAARLVTQNIWLAILYNAIAVPMAVAGFVTPLVAAIAMSASSILVVANSLRQGGSFTGRRTRPVPGPEESYA